MARFRLQLLSVAALVGMAGTGCAHSYQSSSAMQPNASDQQKREQASKQAEIDSSPLKSMAAIFHRNKNSACWNRFAPVEENR